MNSQKKSVERVSVRINQETLDIVTRYMSTYGVSKSDAIIALIHKGNDVVDTLAPEPSLLASIYLVLKRMLFSVLAKLK